MGCVSEAGMTKARMGAKKAERARSVCRYCEYSEVRLLAVKSGRACMQMVCVRGGWHKAVGYDASCPDFTRAPGADDDLGD